ncbi:peptidase S26B, signal peptidase [Xylanimonas cellulosilytica DSM 15894]|uniref:Peptidase S26B, signal peptidase n=1 Tax=Xylanimonas cellulosilytica (strain DSM 15894 / JCM 12276 / CECT 5975 / KCTC 9989 / LMG 20990 / NBRC 107835 / XIL07) TaxID=446471 RepID=D1BY58_XYLCX|nr:S26 family signal peptidase [Xylanimonas cellulosilytica]ACZ29901.1 peptidase S26B, signal peptidase [Xylanimonas cellulosilytica DSM 15894]
MAHETAGPGLASPTTARGGVPPAHEPLPRTVVRWLWVGVTWGLLLAVIAIAVAAIVVPKIAGAVPLTVLSNSMAPTMPVGSLAVIRPTMPIEPNARLRDTDTIRERNDVTAIGIGDVISFQPDQHDATLITHRVIAVSVDSDGNRTFTTRGDNNGSPDSPVQDYQVRATVWYSLPLLGYVNDAVNGDHRRTFAITAAALGYAWALSLWARAHKRRRTARDVDGRIT